MPTTEVARQRFDIVVAYVNQSIWYGYLTASLTFGVCVVYLAKLAAVAKRRSNAT